MPGVSSTGHKGITIHARSKSLQALYYKNGVTYMVGYYKDLDEAVKARNEFIKILNDNWNAYLYQVSKYCVQKVVRFIMDNPDMVTEGDEHHNIMLRVIKEYDTDPALRIKEQLEALERRRVIQDRFDTKK